MKRKLLSLIISGATLCSVAFGSFNTYKNNGTGSDNPIAESPTQTESVSDKKTNAGTTTGSSAESIVEIDSTATGDKGNITCGNSNGTTNNNNTITNPETPNINTQKPSDSGNSQNNNHNNSTDNSTNNSTDDKIDDSSSSENNNSTNVSEDKFMKEVEQLIYAKVNEERQKAGVATLSYNTTMEKYARIKSQDMGDRNYFAHENPEGQLITTNMAKDGVTYRAWGENIAYIGGVTSASQLAEQFMTNWMNSAGHKANILSTNFTSIGIGVYKSGNRVYATQEFYK